MDDNRGSGTDGIRGDGEERPPVDPTISPDLSGVRSGDLIPQGERAPFVPVADSTAIAPGRAIPPEEITAIIDRYRHVDPIEAMIPVLQEMQVKFGYITQAAGE